MPLPCHVVVCTRAASDFEFELVFILEWRSRTKLVRICCQLGALNEIAMARPESPYDEEEQAFLSSSQETKNVQRPEPKAGRGKTWYFRLFLDVAMAVAIAALLARPYVEKRTTKPSPLPDCTQNHLFQICYG